MIGAANPALGTAIKVCIRTGARPGCEFAKLTAKHVRDNGNRMEWVFRPEESKTHILRIIRITDPELLAIVRVVLIILFAVDKCHDVSILLDRSRFAQMTRLRLVVAA